MTLTLASNPTTLADAMIESLTTPGTLLMGKYRVEKVLGQGAMGVVVAATHVDLRQRVALKFMLPGKGPNPERDARFLREARIAAQLTSQHVARVLDVGTMGDSDTPYLVMEHLEGKDLDAVLAERGPLSIAEAVGHVLQVCEAVAEAHKAGIVHRDLKPANLFLTRLADGSPCIKVLDFGVSKLTEPSAALTQEAAVIGSPLYMSPEQMQASRGVDARSDVWSLGIALYELVANRTPFHGDTIQEVCARVFQGAPTPLATFRGDAPAGFEAVLLRCFEKTRPQRWQSVAELAAALVPFGPARGIVHAERAAAILGLNSGPAGPSDLLPSAPGIAAPPRASAPSGAVWSAPEPLATPPVVTAQASSRGGRTLAIGLGLTVVALAGVTVAVVRGSAKVMPERVEVATSLPAPTAPLPSAQQAAGPSSVAPELAKSAGPTTPVSSARQVPLPPRGPVGGRAIAAPPKKNPLDRE